ncbi:3-hydroxybutyryl-CoA dehydrogenase [Paradesulfitobacterium aromaticivorans]
MKSAIVIGGGNMGSGIAQVLAQAGLDVVLYDVSAEILAKGIKNIQKNLSRMVEKGKIDEGEYQNITRRIKTTPQLEGAEDVDLVIEAINENMELKKKVFAQLDSICPEKTILASNTSSLSITEIACATKRADKVIGMHFFNPVPVMQLVEIIKGATTSDQTYEQIKDLVKQLAKTPVTVQEAPGFVVNRMLIPMINEAAFILSEGVASAEDIDTAMKLGANNPLGPLALADLIGLDVCLAVMEVLQSEFGDDKYRPCPLLRKMVRAGYLGRKSGRGFYQY